ncbi:hypothetical protein D3C75_1333080 [compost metagenome]
MLPYSPEVRLNAKNQGLTLFELAPRESLTQHLKALGERLARRTQSNKPARANWLNRLWGHK